MTAPQFTRFGPHGPAETGLQGWEPIDPATLLSGGSLLLIGGTDRLSGPAHDDAFLLPPNGARFEFLDNTLNVARTGHTATRLPDGRVLILGGSRTNDVASILDLVETVEIFDPETLQFDIVPFEAMFRSALPSPLRSARAVESTPGPASVSKVSS